MFTVGVKTKRSSDARQGRSCAQRSAESMRLAVASLEARGRRVEHARFSAAEAGRAASAKPSMAGSPSAVTSVASACTRWKAGLSRRARLLEWTSFFGPAAPLLAARHQLQLDDALGAERHRHACRRGPAPREGMKTPVQRLSAALHLRPLHHLAEVRRADLLLALGDQHEVDRQLLARAADRVQRGQERGLAAPSGSPRRGPSGPCRSRACRRARPPTAATTTPRGRPASRRT